MEAHYAYVCNYITIARVLGNGKTNMCFNVANGEIKRLFNLWL